MIVMIDNYDSFTYNLVQYLRRLGAEVQVFRNDALTVDEIDGLAPSRHRDLAGTGPARRRRHLPGGHPTLLRPDPDPGGLPGPPVHRRGLRRARSSGPTPDARQDLRHHRRRQGVFKGIQQPFQAMRYHSLAVVRDDLPDCLTDHAPSPRTARSWASATGSTPPKASSSTRNRS